MKKLLFGSLAVTSLMIIGCGADPSKDARKCVQNMTQVQFAVEQWCENKKDYRQMPTMKQLVDDGSVINQEMKCPTDGAEYTWRQDEESGRIKVSCPHADHGHKIK